jgi:hypothetical protein
MRHRRNSWTTRTFLAKPRGVSLSQHKASEIMDAWCKGEMKLGPKAQPFANAGETPSLSPTNRQCLFGPEGQLALAQQLAAGKTYRWISEPVVAGRDAVVGGCTISGRTRINIATSLRVSSVRLNTAPT